VQGCSSNEQSRHTTGQCKCGGNAPNNKCKAEHGQHCINQKCVVPTKKWLCEKNSGEWNKPIQKTITQQQKATTYFVYPMKGGGGGLTAGPVISKEEAMESAHYCSKNVKDIKNKHMISGGVASQSKTLNNDIKYLGAQKARDGNRESFTHTPNMDNPWWKLKFDSPKKIEYVSMRTRIDCCGERLNGAQVTVLTVENTWVKCGSPVSADNKRGNQNGKVFKKECPKNLRVKEVKITRPGKHLILTLINVEVGQKVDKNKCRAKRLKNQGNNNCKRGSLYKKGGKGDCNTHYHDKGEHGVDACALACGAEAKCKKFTYGKRLGCRISNNGPKDTCPLANYGGDVYTLV
tara:strand:+ start:1534 stop:2577 length:1044 start_codon:yes stop_codon:yes gene_type:complete